VDKRFRDASNTPPGYSVRVRSPRRYSVRGRSGQARRRLGVDYAPSAMPVVAPMGTLVSGTIVAPLVTGGPWSRGPGECHPQGTTGRLAVPQALR
jgi:hypothetical protein